MKNTAEALTAKKTERSSSAKTRALVITAMMGAVSFVLMQLEFAVPFVPSFLKMDLSDFPALLTSFALGPVWGICVCLVKNLLHLLQTKTAGVGELANFLLGVCYVVPAGLIYRIKKCRKNAILGAVAGCLGMAFGSLPVNYFITYPAYYKFMHIPEEAILGMYQALLPSVSSIFMCLLIFNVPFTLVKALLSSAVVFPLYKPLSPFIKGSGGRDAG